MRAGVVGDEKNPVSNGNETLEQYNTPQAHRTRAGDHSIVDLRFNYFQECGLLLFNGKLLPDPSKGVLAKLVP